MLSTDVTRDVMLAEATGTICMTRTITAFSTGAHMVSDAFNGYGTCCDAG